MVTYKKINLMVPTYKRSGTKLPVFIDTALETVSSKDNLCFTFCVNANDFDTQEYLSEKFRDSGIDMHIIPESEPKPNLAKYFNAMYGYHKKNIGDDVAVSMFGDDMEFQTPGWDKKMLQALNLFGGVAIVYGDDMKSPVKKMCVNFITSMRLVEAQYPFPFMCDEFSIDIIDLIWQIVGEELGLAIYLNEVKIFHNHATLEGRMDKVWERMREQLQETNQHWETNKDRIITERIDAIRKNLKDFLFPDIKVIMTTKDRTDLLIRTANSYKECTFLPDRIYIYDDCSEKIDDVYSITSTIPGRAFLKGEEPLGCKKKTPAVLKEMFDENGAKAVFILDSDTMFARTWWLRLRALYDKVKDLDDFGFLTLFNQRDIPGEPDEKIPSVIRKRAAGAFGTLVTKESYNKYTKKVLLEDEEASGWDGLMCMEAHSDGKVTYCSAPSFLQHTGYTKGTNVDHNGNPTIADDFDESCLDTRIEYSGMLYCKSSHVNAVQFTQKAGPRKPDILFCLPARAGDIIGGSMIANQLIDKGHDLSWICLKSTQELVSYVCPKANVYITGSSAKEQEWGYLDTWQMKEMYPGHSIYINAQFGAPENHYNYVTSHMRPMDWLKEMVERITGINLSDKYTSFLSRSYDIKDVLKGFGLLELVPSDKFAIIAPHARTVVPALTSDMAIKKAKELNDQGYVTRFLVKNKPDDIGFRQAKMMYIWGMTFPECINLLRRADIFIGNDSGMSWASLYSKCKKEIYHSQDRIEKVNTYFSALDQNATDIIIQENGREKRIDNGG